MKKVTLTILLITSFYAGSLSANIAASGIRNLVLGIVKGDQRLTLKAKYAFLANGKNQIGIVPQADVLFIKETVFGNKLGIVIPNNNSLLTRELKLVVTAPAREIAIPGMKSDILFDTSLDAEYAGLLELSHLFKMASEGTIGTVQGLRDFVIEGDRLSSIIVSIPKEKLPVSLIYELSELSSIREMAF